VRVCKSSAQKKSCIDNERAHQLRTCISKNIMHYVNLIPAMHTWPISKLHQSPNVQNVWTHKKAQSCSCITAVPKSLPTYECRPTYHHLIHILASFHTSAASV